MYFQPGQIIDIRAMLNDATRINVEEGSNDFANVGNVSHMSLSMLGSALLVNTDFKGNMFDSLQNTKNVKAKLIKKMLNLKLM